jgi:superkiller protein 3
MTFLTTIGDHDVNILREYIEFFPNTGLAMSLKAFLNSEISPFPTVKEEKKAEEGDKDAKKKDAKEEKPKEPELIEDIIEERLNSMIVGRPHPMFHQHTDYLYRMPSRNRKLQFYVTVS